jgi:hypothetical protein
LMLSSPNACLGGVVSSSLPSEVWVVRLNPSMVQGGTYIFRRKKKITWALAAWPSGLVSIYWEWSSWDARSNPARTWDGSFLILKNYRMPSLANRYVHKYVHNVQWPCFKHFAQIENYVNLKKFDI